MNSFKMSRLVIYSILVFCINFYPARPAAADGGEDPSRGKVTISMEMGESVVMPASRLERVAVGNPAVANAVVFPNTDNQFVLNALAPGITTLNSWDASGLKSYRVVVSHTATFLESAEYELKNYSLTQPVYNPLKTTVTNTENQSSVDNLKAMLTPLLGEGNFAVDIYGNRVTTRGTEADIAAALEALKALDKPVRQVSIEAKILDLTKEDLKRMGLSMLAQRGDVSSSVTMSEKDDGAASLTFDTFTSLIKRFKVTYDSLNQVTEGNTLSNPKITAMDGKISWILVGQKFPVASRDKNDIVSYEYINTGIVLAIRPRIGDDGYINLWLRPEVSAITSWVGDPTSSAVNSAPIISTREAISELRVKDGEPVVIGGLKRTMDLIVRSKVPILGDIPVLGKAFRKKHTESSETELVIIITPHILGDGEPVSSIESREKAGSEAAGVAPGPAAEDSAAPRQRDLKPENRVEPMTGSPTGGMLETVENPVELAAVSSSGGILEPADVKQECQLAPTWACGE